MSNFVLQIGIVAALATLAAVWVLAPFHFVPEGHVGIYKRFGAIQDGMTKPGLHFHTPLITDIMNVQVTLQTDRVENIPCGTKEGITVYFGVIEVDNQLNETFALATIRRFGPEYDSKWIFAKIHHEINQFCSGHTLQEVYIDQFSTIDESLAAALQADCDKHNTGITIQSIRVTKPRIPPNILTNYERLSSKMTELEIQDREFQLEQKRLARKLLEETQAALRASEVARIDAERAANVSIINEKKLTAEKEEQSRREQVASEYAQRRMTLEKQAEAERARLDVAMFAEREKAHADAQRAHVAVQQARMTPEYLQLEAIHAARALANVTRIYYGDKLPAMAGVFDIVREMLGSQLFNS